MTDGIEAAWIYVDGQVRAIGERHVSALDRGFTLGDGVFETIRVADGKPFRLAVHLARLRTSANALQLPIPWSDEDLASGVSEVTRANRLAEAVVRLTVSRGAARARGLLPPPHSVPTLVVQASPFRELSPEKLARGFGVSTSAIRRNESSPTSRIKTCNYLDNVLARLEAERAGSDEAVMLNSAGYLACCSAANLFLVAEGRIRTPAVECGVLAGITRQVVRELIGHLGLVWEEGWLSPAELVAAEGAFLTNSVLGVVPITSVDGHPIGGGRPSIATSRLRWLYEDLVRG